ncbi:DNA methyltransferase [Treponema sp. C6A8]|uniref:DNA methyltransferase n=1 Tax=Treponema sp. C6A8 TaxID=1410609 RepID=UPI0004802E2B|nr:DNA methyltransferase [Treponema sp. C6A8]
MKSAEEFIKFAKTLKGDEKGEAQTFLNHFFQIFGYEDVVTAGGTFESRIKFSDDTTKFADCLFAPLGQPGVLIEMKKRAEKNLEKHFEQVKNYWIEMNPSVVIGPKAQKPRYIILCNFDVFIIYDYLSLADIISIDDLKSRKSAFNFMYPDGREPNFHNNIEKISKDVARTIGEIYKYEVFDKKEPPLKVQRFLLQCVLSMFSEDFGLLPNGLFTTLVKNCVSGKENTYDELGGLFRQMSSKTQAEGGKYKNVPYFNGGLFKKVEPLQLDFTSLRLLEKACEVDWTSVNPAIFGSLFEGTMNAAQRHEYGAHFTSELDIQKIVNPCIVRPWKEKLEKAKTVEALDKLIKELKTYKVLDPACGSGNFLFVAYLALKQIELDILDKISELLVKKNSKKSILKLYPFSVISTTQFFGIEIQPVAVELAKVTMMLAKEIGADKWHKHWYGDTLFEIDSSLPLDNMDNNILCQDALLTDWPEFDVVIGNPPYQSKNKMKAEMDNAYIEEVRQNFPDVPRRADYCVFWFRKAHELMKKGQRAGLVGTNTIRQNDSRVGGLDYIVDNGGTIFDAVSTQVWSGDAVVHVSIVNWIKDNYKGNKTLTTQKGDSKDSPFEHENPTNISSALKSSCDVKTAFALKTNQSEGFCYQGQTHGNEFFLIKDLDKAKELLDKNPKNKEVLFPFLIGDRLVGAKKSQPDRYVIDFRKQDIFAASTFKELFTIIEEKVKPEKNAKAEEEKRKNEETLKKNPNAKVNHDHENAYKSWWQFFRPRNEVMNILESKKRYIVCSRVTKRPIFEFISSEIHPNDALVVFPLEDDYSFGIFSSTIHWLWFNARCSSLKGDPRYTSDTVFDSFPWPQNPKEKDIRQIAKLSCELRIKRNEIMEKNNFSLRDLYKLIESTPNNPVSEIQNKLDNAVKLAYGIKDDDDILEFLLNLNYECHKKEESGKNITPPGLPSIIKNVSEYISDDCVRLET